MKFFYDSQDYGFLVCHSTGEDVFFHYDDMKETGITRQQLIYGSNKPFNSGNRAALVREHLRNNSSALLLNPSQIIQQHLILFKFDKLAYNGRYGKSYKAVNIRLEDLISLKDPVLPLKTQP